MPLPVPTTTHTCTECGTAVRDPHLYREFPGGVIKLSRCECCGLAVDKYIEYDPVVLFQDILLLKTPAYRHLLCNATINPSVYPKLALMTLLCNAYIKQLSVSPGPNTGDNIALLELRFYASLIVAGIGFSVYTGIVWILLAMLAAQPSPTCRKVINALILTSFAQLLAVAAAVWGSGAVHVLRSLAELLGMAASSQAIFVLSRCGQFTSHFVILTAWLMRYGLDQQLLGLVAASL